MANAWSSASTDKGGGGSINGLQTTGSIIVRGTTKIPSTGKWYWEFTVPFENSEAMGISNKSLDLSTFDFSGYTKRTGLRLYEPQRAFLINDSGYQTAYAGVTKTTNGTSHVFGVAVDMDAGTLEFYRDNVSLGTAFSDLKSLGDIYPTIMSYSNVTVNFGTTPFTYSPPSGYFALDALPPSVSVISPSAGVMTCVGDNVLFKYSATDTGSLVTLKLKLKKADNSETTLDTAVMPPGVAQEVSVPFTSDMLNGSLIISALNQAGLTSTKTIAFSDKKPVAAVDVSNIMFKNGDVVKVSAINGGTIITQSISPALGAGTITGVSLTPATVHAEATTLAGVVGSTKGNVRYRVLCGGTEIKAFSAYGSSFNISELLQTLTLPAGANVLTIETENESGVIVTGTVTLTKNNNNPTITAALTQLSLTASFADADNDDLQYRVLVDGVEKVPWTAKDRGVQVTHEFTFADLDYYKLAVPFTNVIRVEVKDVAGGVAFQEFTVAPTDMDAVITVTQESVSLPKDTPYNMAFTIDPPMYANPIVGAEVQPTSTADLGGGKVYTFNLDRYVKLQSLSVTV